jgi:hypothetical protein
MLAVQRQLRTLEVKDAFLISVLLLMFSGYLTEAIDIRRP